MNEERTEPNDERRIHIEMSDEAAAIEDALGTLFRVGRMWAKHGLRVAELALQTSAETLRVTAESLNSTAERLGSEEQPEA